MKLLSLLAVVLVLAVPVILTVAKVALEEGWFKRFFNAIGITASG